MDPLIFLFFVTWLAATTLTLAKRVCKDILSGCVSLTLEVDTTPVLYAR